MFVSLSLKYYEHRCSSKQDRVEKTHFRAVWVPGTLYHMPLTHPFPKENTKKDQKFRQMRRQYL